MGWAQLKGLFKNSLRLHYADEDLKNSKKKILFEELCDHQIPISWVWKTG